MIGSHDRIAIADLPDSVSAAAMYIAAASSGDFTHNQTHQPLTQEQLANTLQRASTAAQASQPPGQQANRPNPGAANQNTLAHSSRQKSAPERLPYGCAPIL